MYKAFFGFEETPFASKPDPGFFFRGNEHDASLRGLIFAVQARMGLISLTGEEGTGKTTVLECLRESLESDNIPCAFIRDPRISVDGFFQNIASDLDLQCQGGASAYKVFSALSQLMAQQTRRGRTVALIVDDAHNLPADVFNEIIHIASLHDDKAKLIQTIFAGRPELLPMLHKLNLERLKQPTILSRTLHPFELQETKQYIEFRLARAGMPKQTIFSTGAMEEIHDLSHGFPPAIHELCERLLLAAFADSSQVCTEQILSQVFNRQPRNPANIVEVAASVVAPPPMSTTLLQLAFAALPSSPLPALMSASEYFDPFPFTSLQPLFPPVLPCRSTALSVGEFPLGSATPVWLTNGAKAASVPNLSIGSVPFAPSLPRHPAFAALEICGVAEHHFPDSPLTPLGCYIKSKSPFFSAAAAANFSSVPYAPALLPLRPVARLLPAGMIRLPHVPVTPFRVAKNSRLSRGMANDAQPSILGAATLLPTQPVASLQPSGIMQSPCVPFTPVRVAKDSPQPPRAATNVQFEKHTPAIAGGLTASHNLLPLASRVPLPPCDTYVKPSAPLEWAAAGAHLFSMPGAAPLQPVRAAMSLRPSATICWPRVPVVPFKIGEQGRTSARADIREQIEPVNLSLAMPVNASGLTVLRQKNNPLPLISSVRPYSPLPALPVKPFLYPVLSVQAWRPASKIVPVDPLSPDFLRVPAWTPAATRPEATFPPKVSRATPIALRTRLLTLAIPLLAGIAVYGTPPAASALTQGWRRTQQAVLNRAAIALDEDFRSGLKSWTNGGGAPPSWTSDAAGFVHPGALALYRPSLGLVDYQMQFMGMIDKKSLSWVVRAADFKNYYAIRLTVLKPGPVPTIGVTRYAVIDGKTQNRVTTPLVMRAQADTVYRVRLDVRGDRFVLWVQDQQVDSWSQPDSRQGGIGFFSAQDSASRVSGVQVRGQYDTLGRLCAFLVPAGQSPDARP